MTTGVEQFPAGAGLEQGVDAFWAYAAPAPPGAAPGPVRVLPDGCVDLICQFPRAPDGRPRDARLFIAGAATRAQLVALEAGTCLVGVRFRPGMSRLVIDADPEGLAGRDTPAEAVDPGLASLADRLAGAGDAGAALLLLRAEVRRRAAARSRGTPPRRVRAALALLGRPGPEAGIGEVAGALGVAERTLRRDVLDWTGLPPKTLARVLRFQAALARLQGGPRTPPLALVAQEHGYADQAHMAREFRALAGLPPSALLGPGRVRSVQDGPAAAR